MKRLSYLLLLIALSWHSAASADLAESLQQANSDYQAGQIAAAQRQYETLLAQTTWGQPDQVAVKFQTIQALTSLYRKTSNLAGLIEITNQLIEFSNSEIFSQIHQLTKSATYAMAGLNRWTALLATGETETALRRLRMLTSHLASASLRDHLIIHGSVPILNPSIFYMERT